MPKRRLISAARRMAQQGRLTVELVAPVDHDDHLQRLVASCGILVHGDGGVPREVQRVVQQVFAHSSFQGLKHLAGSRHVHKDLHHAPEMISMHPTAAAWSAPACCWKGATVTRLWAFNEWLCCDSGACMSWVGSGCPTPWVLPGVTGSVQHSKGPTLKVSPLLPDRVMLISMSVDILTLGYMMRLPSHRTRAVLSSAISST